MHNLARKIINEIIELEGGYIDDPDDSGGATNYGITESVARANDYMGPMENLPRDLAFTIYFHKYLEPIRFNDLCEISEDIAEELADTAVNQGVHRASLFFQRCLNAFNNRQQYYKDISVDGHIGTKTIHAFKAYMDKRGVFGELVFFRALNALQGAFYIELVERREKDEKWIYGWFRNRIR